MSALRGGIVLALGLLAAAPVATQAQGVFGSVHTANLPTTRTPRAGAWLFEISHRFDTPISRGSEAFWGLDGPVFNRLGLAWAPRQGVMLGLLRSNFNDNLEVNGKVRGWSGGGDALRVEVAFAGGAAWNTEVFETAASGARDNEFQGYAQVIVNAAPGDRVALGLVPTWIRNPRIDDEGPENGLALGVVGQLSLSRSVKVLAEWLATKAREGLEHDPVSLGVGLETPGHTFRLLVTNQSRLNPTQFLGGSPTPFTPDEWRFGFNITRILPF